MNHKEESSETQLLLLFFIRKLDQAMHHSSSRTFIVGQLSSDLLLLKCVLFFFLSLDVGCCCFCSVSQSCPTLCNPMDCSMPGFPVLHHFLEFAQTHELVMAYNQLILFHPLLILPSIFPNIRVFSSELALHIRWPKYCSFRFSISAFNEYSELISFQD